MTKNPSQTLAWATDLHLDQTDPDVILKFIEKVRARGAAALLIGGDISTAAVFEEHLVEISEKVGIPVYFVLGNHDFYGGSFAAMRKRMTTFARPNLHWLAKEGPQKIAPGLALVGTGGWGDARLGDFPGSDVVLTDYLSIAELRKVFNLKKFTGVFGPGSDLETELRRLGLEAAQEIAPHLTAAAKKFQQVIVLTHVPPFQEAAWHEGQISKDKFLPGLTCGAMGEVLTEAALAHPQCTFTVLCGHTHGSGFARIAPNLVVHTQAANFGHPDFLLMEASRDQVHISPSCSPFGVPVPL